jgi:hypothetical protein
LPEALANGKGYPGSGSHGDILAVLGIAAVLHERPFASQITAMARRYGPDRVFERRQGNRRYRGDTAREIVDARLEHSRQEAEDYMRAERARFAAAGWGMVTHTRSESEMDPKDETALAVICGLRRRGPACNRRDL